MKFLSMFVSINDTYEMKSGNHVFKFMICGWQGLTFILANWFSCTPKLLDRLNYESKGENNGRRRN
jgi:hypothetical protein